MFASSWFILLFPLAGFIFLSWYGKRISKAFVGLIGCGTVGMSFVTSLVALSDLLFLPAEEGVGKVLGSSNNNLMIELAAGTYEFRVTGPDASQPILTVIAK